VKTEENNPWENAPRPFAAARSWLFAGTGGGPKASASLCSPIEACEVNGVEPYCDLVTWCSALPLAAIADANEVLLPWRLDLP